MPDLTFTFSVDAQGRFTYDPAQHPNLPPPPEAEWRYSADDSLTFRCATGPFTLKLTRTDQAPGTGGMTNPFPSPLKATQAAGGQWEAKVPTINDGLSRAVRKAVYSTSRFVAKYRYVIGISLADGTIAVDDSHAGTHTC